MQYISDNQITCEIVSENENTFTVKIVSVAIDDQERQYLVGKNVDILKGAFNNEFKPVA